MPGRRGLARLRGWDDNLHHAIATAAHNKLIICPFETLNVVRRSMVWGQRRATRKPLQGYQSFAEYDAIVAAILSRDVEDAAAAMRRRLNSDYSRILPTLDA